MATSKSNVPDQPSYRHFTVDGRTENADSPEEMAPAQSMTQRDAEIVHDLNEAEKEAVEKADEEERKAEEERAKETAKQQEADAKETSSSSSSSKSSS